MPFPADWSETSLPPVVCFGDPLETRQAAQRTTVDLDLGVLRTAFATFDGFLSAEPRMAAVAAVAAAARDCARSQQIDIGELPEPRSEVQRYFRIRTAELSANTAMLECLRVIGDATEDLVNAPLAGSDLTRVMSAMSAVIDSVPAKNVPALMEQLQALPRTNLAAEEMWMRRWVVGHQLHAMLNVHAAYALADAAEGLRSGDQHRAVRALDNATRIVEGFAGARAQALAVPDWFYQEVLRLSMLPPLTSVPLSGRMHTEYRGYRKRLGEVINLMPQSSKDLASTHPRLAFARERLLEADLIEAERHVTSVEPLVSLSRSLIQTSKSTDNAVSALRRIRHRRAAEIEPYVRFPDRLGSFVSEGLE
jgi:hypothetical protein